MPQTTARWRRIAPLFALLLGGCGSSSPKASEPSRAVQPPQTPPVKASASARPELAAIALEAPILERPDRNAKRLGYLRLGARAVRSAQGVRGRGCSGLFYAIEPAGYVCVGSAGGKSADEATLELDHKLLRALTRLPDRTKPMPYNYGFLRATTALYLQLPNKEEQAHFEFGVHEHRKAYATKGQLWNKAKHGDPNTVPLDVRGIAVATPDAPYPQAPAPLDERDFFGTTTGDTTPWYFARSVESTKAARYDRAIPNVASFQGPRYAVYGGRVYRHAGLPILTTFQADERGDRRRFAVTLDGRLVPADKIKPHFASPFHGVAIDGTTVRLPFAFVRDDHVSALVARENGRLRADGTLPKRSVHNLSGRTKTVRDQSYLELASGRWVRSADLAVVDRPAALPKELEPLPAKWIDVSIWQQTLVAYEGNRPVYATLVSTGKDGMGDPKTTKSTVRGTFRIGSKHVTATMDADDPDNRFELRDVPWVEYFEQGYALHTAYWHDDFGHPRSHGCVNLAPIDARWLFFWTTPELPASWHGVYAGQRGPGTFVHIHG